MTLAFSSLFMRPWISPTPIPGKRALSVCQVASADWAWSWSESSISVHTQ